jgi:hypothetical protein
MPTAVLEQKDRTTLEKPRFADPRSRSKYPESNRDAEADGLLPSPPVRQSRLVSEEDVPQGPTEATGEILKITPFVEFPPCQAPRMFTILQQWEGVVSEVTEDSVWAELLDLTDRSKALEIVELPLDEIAESDRPLLKPGCVFYWCIGYENPSGTRRRVSEIRVRRTPEWSDHSIDSVRSKARELLRRLDEDGKNHTTRG